MRSRARDQQATNGLIEKSPKRKQARRRGNANASVGAMRAWRWVWGYLTIVNCSDLGGELAPAALVAVMVTV